MVAPPQPAKGRPPHDAPPAAGSGGTYARANSYQVKGGAASALAICRRATYCGCVSKPITQMREPTYFVLASLLDGPLHGYAIIQRTAELSDSRIRLATGTLYTALDRLSAEGYVELVREEIVNGRARRSYGLTSSGADALRAEAKRMAEAARLVTERGRRLKVRSSVRKATPA
jgi:PadR family transcriptional regulator, regulatory protein PadR